MNNFKSVLKSEEKAAFALRSLYSKNGYSQYKMSKFEEYDLYVRNKDFLVSDSVITFTDTNGKLLALKPDVTLSIIKNSSDKGLEKLYYNENVYRVSKGTHSYKEIMQVGLECIGDIDDYCLGEVLVLAAESLKTISNECVLDVSHLGVVSDVLAEIDLDDADKSEILRCIGEKNFHEISLICDKASVGDVQKQKLHSLVNLYGTPESVLPKVKNLVGEENKGYKQLCLLSSMLTSAGFSDIVRIDFSVMNDMNYYNGIVFKGFVAGIPLGVLSGGQYDKLLKKMGKKSGAVGFAVYLDLLERFEENESSTDFDVLLLYTEQDNPIDVLSAANEFKAKGKTVAVRGSVPKDMRFSEIYKYSEKGVKPIENA